MADVLGNILTGILVCLCWPFLLRSRGRQVREHEIISGIRPNPNRVPPRSRIDRRRRALTLPSSLPTDPQTGNFKLSQPSCRLLTKLPTELRQQIWRECIGGITFHLELWRDYGRGQPRLYHVICRSPYPENCDEITGRKGCWRYTRSPAVSEMPKRQLVSILLTCRQIYSEAIHHLYESNAFITNHQEVVQYLPRFFLPQRIKSIRSFRFKWYEVGTPAYPATEGLEYKNMVWRAIWRIFADMQGLDELHVKFVTGGSLWENMDTEKAIALLEPVMEVTSPKYFELSLPFPCISDEAPWRALPCRIRRTTDLDGL